LTNSTVCFLQDQEPSSVSKPFANLTPLIAHLPPDCSHSRNRDSIWRSSRRKRSYFECSNIICSVYCSKLCSTVLSSLRMSEQLAWLGTRVSSYLSSIV